MAFLVLGKSEKCDGAIPACGDKPIGCLIREKLNICNFLFYVQSLIRCFVKHNSACKNIENLDYSTLKGYH
jgi:hypothetical protein